MSDKIHARSSANAWAICNRGLLALTTRDRDRVTCSKCLHMLDLLDRIQAQKGARK